MKPVRTTLTLWAATLLACGPLRGPGAAPAVSEPSLTRREIDPARHPDAVCNDGSRPVFYVRRGAERGRWVVWFQGGGACGDQATCEERPPPLTGSGPWRRVEALDGRSEPIPPDSRAAGILSADPAQNPDLHAWNHVLIPYCSSDQWAGDRGASPGSFGWHFRGSRIADAVLDALADPAVVGARPIGEAEQVLFAGSSAGASGVRTNVDRLVARLPGVKVHAVSDAALSPAFTPVRVNGEEAAWRRNLALWGARPDDSCVAAVGAEAAWRCLDGRVLAEEDHLSVPTFWRMDQRDPVVMGEAPATTPEGRQLSREAAAEIRAVVGRRSGGFCPAAANHVALNTPAFTRERIDGRSFAEVLGNWLFDRPGPKVVVDPGTSGPARR